MEDLPPPAALPSLEARRLSELGLHAAGLVHELRQPLFAIKAFAQLGATGQAGVNGDAHKVLADILEQVATMEALLGGYQDFIRNPAGGVQLFDVWASVRSAQVILVHRATAARVRLRVSDGPPLPVRGSMLAIQQAVVNLGQNALDAVQGQADGEVHIACVTDGALVRIVVEDNGPGLPAAILEHLFEPFHTTKAGGTGLGLSISREMLAASGATLRLVDGPHTRWEIELQGVRPDNGAG